MEAKVLVYQAYGNQEVVRQAMFSVVSLFHLLEPQDPLQIFIYTDDQKTFSDFFGAHPRLRYIAVTSEQIQAWRGKNSFVHRAKIEILIDAAKRFKGCLFYCDADTYFLESPSHLFARVNDRYSVMHAAATSLDKADDPVLKKILKFVKTHHFQVKNELVGIGPSTVMWNSCVLGLSEKNKSLLPKVLELTDQTFEQCRKQVMEQLAFSFFLQTKSEIIPADSVIYHDWKEKVQYQPAINQFLNETGHVEKALEKYPEFQFPELEQPRRKKSLIRKILHKQTV